MKPHSVIYACTYMPVFLGGFALFIAPFSANGRAAANWMRLALWLAGTFCIGWSVVGLTSQFFYSSLSPHARFVLLLTKTFLGGMAVGILTLLFVSGEFLPAFFFRSPSTER